jgi:hypothetical protein
MHAAVARIAVMAAVVAKAMVMGTVTAAATSTERGPTKVAKGKQATEKVKRRSSSAQQYKQPITKQETAKVARVEQMVYRHKEEEQWHMTQHTTTN